MFISEARKAAKENVRLAQATGDSPTITAALEALNVLTAKEDRIRARRARQRQKQEAAKPAVAPVLDDGDEPFDFEPPPDAIPFPETVATPFGDVIVEPDDSPAPPAAKPAAQPYIAADVAIHFMPFEQVTSRSFSGGQWNDIRELDEQTANEIAWQQRSDKLYGR